MLQKVALGAAAALLVATLILVVTLQKAQTRAARTEAGLAALQEEVQEQQSREKLKQLDGAIQLAEKKWLEAQRRLLASQRQAANLSQQAEQWKVENSRRQRELEQRQAGEQAQAVLRARRKINSGEMRRAGQAGRRRRTSPIRRR